MTRPRWIPGVLALVALQGCAYRIVDRATLDTEVHARSAKHGWGLIWYLGSSDGHHFVKLVYGMFQERWFRVPERALPIAEPFPYTNDETRWRVLKRHDDPWPLPEPLRFQPLN